MEKKRIDKISGIPYWSHIAGIALFSRHPHSRAINEGLKESDIDVARKKIALLFVAAVLAIASGALLASR